MIEQKYFQSILARSDINEHLQTLYLYAKKCDFITEFGVRDVVSTWAFANARPKSLVCVDIKKSKNVDEFLSICSSENVNAKFVLSNTLEITIEPTDLLFIDTLHNYSQLIGELSRHSSSVSKYIIMHDTSTYGERDEVGNGCGLKRAISEFLVSNKDWFIKETFTNNNGLTVLERV